MIELINKTDTPVDIEKLSAIAKELADKDIELLIINNDEIQEYNRAYRGIDKPTDVLSFPLQDIAGAPLGSILISVDKAKEASEQFGHSLKDEIALLFIHGLLHLLGYDHEIDEGQMRRKEEELIERFSLPKSLIVRTEG